jgi:hypothetical protein
MTPTENAKHILKTLAWINIIQAHDGATMATAEHRAGLKLLADEFCALIEETVELRARLSRKGKAGAKEKRRCNCGKFVDSPSNRKRSPNHQCWKAVKQVAKKEPTK